MQLQLQLAVTGHPTHILWWVELILVVEVSFLWWARLI